MRIIDNSELGPTVRAKVVQLRELDESLERKKKSQKTEAADLFAFQCRANKLPPFSTEYGFAEAIKRKWRFDFAWSMPKNATSPRLIRLAVEIEGISMRRITIDGKLEWIMGGRHATIQGYKEDCIKYNTACGLMGWTVLRFEQSQVKNGHAVAMTMRTLYRMGWRMPE